MQEDSIPFQQKEARSVFFKLGLSFAAFLGIPMVIQFLMIAVIQLGVVLPVEYNADFALFLSMSIMYIAGFPVFWLLCRRIPVMEVIPRHRWGAGRLIIIFVICLSMVYIGNFASQILMYLAGELTGTPSSNPLQELLMNVNPWVIFLSTVVIAPIAEELIFRKLLIDRIVQYGQGIAILVSGLVFGLAHGNFYQFFYAFGLGMIFAYIYTKTGNIVYTILFHTIINFMGSIVPLMLLRMMSETGIIGMLLMSAYGMVILTATISGVVLLICFRTQITLDPPALPIPKGKRLSTVCLNAGMILYLVLSVVLFLLS